MTFRTNTNTTITTQIDTIEGITADLRDKGLICIHREAEAALTGILNSMERSGKVEVTYDIEKSGFFLVDGKIQCFGLEFKTPTKEQMKECAELLNALVIMKYGNDKRLPTLLKWSVNAPFDYIRKSYKKWLPYVHMYGIPSTAKSTRGEIALAVWKIHDSLSHVIPFTNINSEARLGRVISQTTLPILVNEVGSLKDEKRYGHLVEMIKSAIENPMARASYDKKGRYNKTPALSPLILTGNPPPPVEGGIRSREVLMIYTTQDQHDRNGMEARDFINWLMPELNKLGVLGDFTSTYVMEHPEIIQKQWNDTGEAILTKFYEEAGVKVPEWIKLLVETKQLEQTTDETILLLREYLINLINETYTRHARTRDDINPDIIYKLNECCRTNLIAFMQYDISKKKYYITPTIMNDLRKKNLDGLVGSLEGLAHMLSFECKTNRVLGKVMHSISVDEPLLKDFLQSRVTEMQDKSDEQNENELLGLDEDMVQN